MITVGIKDKPRNLDLRLLLWTKDDSDLTTGPITRLLKLIFDNVMFPLNIKRDILTPKFTLETEHFPNQPFPSITHLTFT